MRGDGKLGFLVGHMQTTSYIQYADDVLYHICRRCRICRRPPILQTMSFCNSKGVRVHACAFSFDVEALDGSWALI
jgi:hypothetical protein